MSKLKGLWWDIFPVFFLIFFAVLMGVVIYAMSNQTDAIEDSCKKIGMEYYRAMESEFCVDKNGNAHYVDIKCKGIIQVECYPKIISIGDIRIK